MAAVLRETCRRSRTRWRPCQRRRFTSGLEPGEVRRVAAVEAAAVDGLLHARRGAVPVGAGGRLHDLRRVSLFDRDRHRSESHHVLVGLQLQPGAARGRHQLHRCRCRVLERALLDHRDAFPRPATRIDPTPSSGRPFPMCSKRQASAGGSIRTRTTTGPAPCTGVWPSRASGRRSLARPSTGTACPTGRSTTSPTTCGEARCPG